MDVNNITTEEIILILALSLETAITTAAFFSAADAIAGVME